MGGGMAAASPVHHFTFDESAEGVVDAADVAGGLSGVFSGSAVRTGGLFGSVGALRMNDTSGGVNIGPSLSLEAATGLTLVAVVDVDWTGSPGDYDEIFRKEDGNSRILFSFQNDAFNGGATPSVVEANLKAYLPPSQRLIVKAPAGEVEVTCGGAPMALGTETITERGEASADAKGGTALGKRYVNADETLEILCTKAGEGSLGADGALLALKEAKPLPASD